MGQARIYMTLDRERLLPPWLAEINASRKTPVNATLLTSVSAGAHLCSHASTPLQAGLCKHANDAF